MLSIFNTNYRNHSSITITPKWDLIKRNMLDELEKVRLYYLNSNRSVRNNHPLVKLIKDMDLNIHDDIFTYVANIDRSYMYVSKNIGIVSTINKGMVLDDSFISSGSSILNMVNMNYDLFNVEDTYDKIVSIKPIRYSGTSVWMNHPYDINEDLDISIFDIDVRLVMVQYKHWALHRINENLDTDPSVFVYTILLNNMIGTLLDISILNRYLGIPSTSNNKKSVISTMNMSSIVDDTLTIVRKTNNKKSMDLFTLLSNIPVITYKNALELLRGNIGIVNSNNSWVVYLSYVDKISTLIGVDDKTARLNHKLFSELYRFMLILKSNKTLNRPDFGLIGMVIKSNFDMFLETVKERK